MGERDTATVVTLTKPFLLGQTEVTQAQWREVMGTEPWKGQQHTIEGDDVAATHVSWNDAVAFCTELTERERASGKIPMEQQYRLPTDADWEFACRAGTGTVYHFGDDESLLGDHAWFGVGWKNGPLPGGNTADEMYPHAVRLKLPNPWGLFDVHGSVWEWVADWHNELSTPAATGQQALPEGSKRVGRGGAWCEPTWACRSAARLPDASSVRHVHKGFWLALGL